jgi:hypothetical protein
MSWSCEQSVAAWPQPAGLTKTASGATCIEAVSLLYQQVVVLLNEALQQLLHVTSVKCELLMTCCKVNQCLCCRECTDACQAMLVA